MKAAGLALALAFGATSPALAAVSWNVSVNDSTASYSSLYPTLIAHAQLAGGDWSNRLQAATSSIEVEIDIHEVASNRGGGTSATTHFVGNRGGFNVWEQGLAAELRTGVDPNGATPDVLIDLDPDYINTQLWFDPDPVGRTTPVPNNRIDDMSFFRHELGHALAWNGWRDWTTGALPADYESTFDERVTVGAGGVPFFNGARAEALYGGPVPLTYGNLYHVGNASLGPGSTLIPDLMNGVVFNYGTRYDISPLDLAIVADTGIPIPEPSGLCVSFLASLAAISTRRKKTVPGPWEIRAGTRVPFVFGHAWTRHHACHHSRVTLSRSRGSPAG
jgi:hypothetical protein